VKLTAPAIDLLTVLSAALNIHAVKAIWRVQPFNEEEE
jgi:hypothetical protein